MFTSSCSFGSVGEKADGAQVSKVFQRTRGPLETKVLSAIICIAVLLGKVSVLVPAVLSA